MSQSRLKGVERCGFGQEVKIAQGGEETNEISLTHTPPSERVEDLTTLGREKQAFTRTLAPFVIWYNVENFVVVVAASIPTIRPLFTRRKQKKMTDNNQGVSSCGTGGSALIADEK